MSSRTKTVPDLNRYYTRAEVELHNAPTDLWVSWLGMVYDLTVLAEERKGDPLLAPLLKNAGKDISHWFDKRTGDLKQHINPLTGAITPYTPEGRFLHVPPPLPRADCQTLEELVQCDKMVRVLGIFSSNETAEDINTGDLILLMIPYYIGILEQKVVDSQREAHLKTSLSSLEFFLDRLKLFEIFDYESYELKKGETQRDRKIRRFKEEKSLKEQQEQLNKRVQERGEDDVDEEIARNLYLTQLKANGLKAIDSVEMTKSELELLEGRKKWEAKRQAGAHVDSQDSKVETAAPFKPFILTNNREQIKKGVFRPGHNLPTMTIDEFLEREIARGNFLQGGTQPKKEGPTDEDEAGLDAETLKARMWDEFKDDNPRGWGNRMNKG
ncbi:hypothetical protein HDU96_000359 [Phlyctochytrium bullatum]|nr:hypothetical protein HDU96_000359 [Phlyctochytrium bullatum]